jgi:hypothetical protein
MEFMMSGFVIWQMAIDRFLEILRPKIKEFLSNHCLLVWMPPDTVDTNIQQFYHNLAIPSTNGNDPNLLLHNLGYGLNPNADILCGNGVHHRYKSLAKDDLNTFIAFFVIHQAQGRPPLFSMDSAATGASISLLHKT